MQPSSRGDITFARDRTKRIPFRTNSDGFRDREVRPKDPAIRRVFVIGDSYTFGYAVEEQEAYPQVTERLLKERGITNIEVRNGGIPGYNTRQEAFLLDEYLPV